MILLFYIIWTVSYGNEIPAVMNYNDTLMIEIVLTPWTEVIKAKCQWKYFLGKTDLKDCDLFMEMILTSTIISLNACFEICLWQYL